MRTRNQNSIYKPVILGVAVSLVSTILFAALAAVFMDNESIQLGTIPYISFVIWIVSGFLGAFLSGWTGEEKWLLRSGISVVVYYIILLAAGILIFDGITNGFASGAFGILIGFTIAVILISRKKRMPRNRKMRNYKI